jgi:hypothetical protein
METSTLSSRTGTIDRQQLALVPTPQGTATHRPIPHYEVVSALVETLGFRHIGIVKEQYACSKDGMKMYGTLDLDIAETDFRFSIGVRNAHDKSMRLAMTVGYRVFCCDNGAFSGDFEPVLAKHSKHFNLVEAISIGVDQMQRNFKPMVEQVDRPLARLPALRHCGQARDLPRLRRGETGDTAPSRPQGALPLLQPAVRGIPAPHPLEPIERLHERVQGTGRHPAVQGYRGPRGVPEGDELKFFGQV